MPARFCLPPPLPFAHCSPPLYGIYIYTYLGLSVDGLIFLTCQSSCSNRKTFKLLPQGAAQRRRRRGAAAGGGWAGGKPVRAPLMLIEFGPQRVQQARSPGPKPSHSQSNGIYIELPHQIELQLQSAKHSSISVKSKLVLHCFAYDMWEGIPVIELFPSNCLTCQLQVNLSSSSACQD